MKEKPEYFQVKEVIDLNFDDKGIYTYVLLKKRNYNTLDAIKKIAEKLRISQKNIGFAGNKDKKAVTWQYLSLPKINRERIEKLHLKDLELKFLSYGNKRISLGDLKLNKFKIRFPYKFRKINFFENYFDEQRFGVNHNNHLLGKLIVQKDFLKLNEIVDSSDYYNYKIKLRFYFNSYQSYLFNSVLAEYLKKYDYFKLKYSLGEFVFLKKKIKNFKIPLINFDTNLKNEVGRIYKKILKKENVGLDDFLIKQFPFLISDTQEREAFVIVKDLAKKKDYLYFTLPKGSYATILIKKLHALNKV